MSRLRSGATALSASVVAASAVIVAAGCAPLGRQPPPASARASHGPRCDEASGEATMGSLAAARYFARANVNQNLGASRGFLASQGVHAVRVAGRDMQCQPYPLGGGLTRCVAVVRLCGR